MEPMTGLETNKQITVELFSGKLRWGNPVNRTQLEELSKIIVGSAAQMGRGVYHMDPAQTGAGIVRAFAHHVCEDIICLLHAICRL